MKAKQSKRSLLKTEVRNLWLYRKSMQALIILREESFSHSPVMKDIFMSLGCLGQWIPEAYYWSQPTNFHSVLEGCLNEIPPWRMKGATPLMLGFLRHGSCGFTSGGPLWPTTISRPPCDKRFKASLRLTLANISIITSTLFTNRFLSFINILSFFVIKYFVGFILKAIFCPSSVAAVPEIF